MTNKFPNKPIPTSAGIGLRFPHYREIIDNQPDIKWFEVHSENFFAEGGMSLYILEQIREKHPMSFHGVGLSLGSCDGLDKKHLEKLKNLVDRFNPALVSEHISWSNTNGITLNDLLPLPYNDESLAVLVDNIKHVQDFLGRQILVENPSTYLEFNESTMTEWEFINKLIEKSGCGLLLDVNNIHVSCTNHGWDSAEYIKNIPYNAVGEIHLAGYEEKRVANPLSRLRGRVREGASADDFILIDTHGNEVANIVWQLYEEVIKRSGCTTTLIEWDNNIPDLQVLITEAEKAQKILNKYEAKNAVA